MNKAKIHFFGMNDEDYFDELPLNEAYVFISDLLRECFANYPSPVILATYDLKDRSTSEIYVSSSRDIIEDLDPNIRSVNGVFIENLEAIHISIYPTWEDAYKVALEMRETEPNCYNE